MQNFPDLLITLALVTSLTTLWIRRVYTEYTPEAAEVVPGANAPPPHNPGAEQAAGVGGRAGADHTASMILTADFAASLKCLKSLRELSLCNCEISAECAEAWPGALAELPQIVHISLHNCKLAGEGAWQACIRGIGAATSLQGLTVVKQVGSRKH